MIVLSILALKAPTFLSSQSNIVFDPVYKTCSRIPVLISDYSRDAKFREKVKTALHEINKFSKAKFYYSGYTEEIPKTPFHPRYPQTNYVVIALIDRLQSNIFPSNNALAAATSFRTLDKTREFHVGVIVVDKAAFAALSPINSSVRGQMTVIRHELGHIAGFGHDSAPTVMNEHALSLFHPIVRLPWLSVVDGSTQTFCRS